MIKDLTAVIAIRPLTCYYFCSPTGFEPVLPP